MRVLTGLVIVMMVAAGCSGESTREAEEASQTTTSAAPPTSTEDEGEPPTTIESDETAPTTAVDVQAASVELVEPDQESLSARAIPVLGGLTLSVDDRYVVHHDGNMAIVRTAFEADAGRYLPSMVIALVSQDASGAPIRTIEELVSSPIRGVGRADATGETLELLGLELQRWSFAAPAARVGPHYIYPVYPNGTSGNSAWQPFPYGELFLGETPDGVVAIGWTGVDTAGMAEARAIFEAVAPTLELAAPWPTTPSPPVESAVAPPFEPAPASVEVPEGFPEELRSGYQAMEAGSYSITTFETAFAFDVDDSWWVQNNFAGLLNLTAIDSFGPGDRSLTLRSEVNGLAAFDSSYRPAGTVQPIGDISDLVANPPPNMVVSADEVLVGGRSAVQVDIGVVPASNCGETDICEYQFTTKYAFPGESVRAGISTRVWVVAEGLATPIWIFAQAADPTWFDQASDVVASIRFE